MARRPDTFETVRIVLELLKRIPRNRKVSAPELHAQLKAAGIDRDIRTIQRHLDFLSEQFDVERDDRSKPYGYRWKEKAQGFSLPGLNERESLLLALAEQHLRNLLPVSVTRSLASFFEQARRNLDPLTKSPREREWLSKVRVVSATQPLLPPKVSPTVFEQVSNSLYGNTWLDVDYKNAQENQTKARVMPLGLAQQGPFLYLVCRFEGFNNERTLALHRIQAARSSTLTFHRPTEFNLQRYDDEGRFGFGSGKSVKLSFRIDKAVGPHLLEAPLSPDQVVKDRRHYYQIEATVIDTKQLEWWLRSFGDAVSNVQRRPVPSGTPSTGAVAPRLRRVSGAPKSRAAP